MSGNQIDIALEEIKNRQKNGELTLFFGAVAGVGKTYAMLNAAKELLKSGKNVAIGYIEKHGRAETDALVDDIPFIALREVDYKGVKFYEPDLDAILSLKPDVVLIDELAHTNAPGLRHHKRYQDVQEILNHGISVYTTMNVQHLESLNDMIFQITGVKVNETVPDTILDRVDKIQIIDIPPEKLIERLKGGKIYKVQTIEKALMNFFKLGNINALREIALKQIAGKVGKDVYDYYKDKQIESWDAVEKIVVCIDGSEFAASLIRHAKRLATQMSCEWIALHIDNVTQNTKSDDYKERLAKNIRLAEELGAEVNIVHGQNLVEEILKHAQSRFATHILIGKRIKKVFGKFWRASFADELINSESEFCILSYTKEISNTQASRQRTTNIDVDSKINIRHYLFGLSSVMIITAVCFFFRRQLELLNVALLLLIPVLMVSIKGNMKASIVITLAGIVCFDFFFVPPVFTFTVSDISFVWSFFIFFVVAYIVASQSQKLKFISEAMRDRERRVRRLFKLSRRMAAASDIKQVAKIAMPIVAESVNKECSLFIKNEQNESQLYAYYDPQSPLLAKNYNTIFQKLDTVYISQSDYAVIEWCFENKEKAGTGTDTFNATDILYLPIKGKDHMYGVFCVKIKATDITTEIKMFLDSVISVMAVSFERIVFADQNSTNAIILAKEELKNALYGSISHDLRTPLASMLGLASVLKSSDICNDKNTLSIVDSLIFNAKRMERLISNMLDSARFESKGVVLRKDWCDISDIFSLAINEFEDSLKNKIVCINITSEDTIFNADCVLIERVLINLIENAIKYSKDLSKIELQFSREEKNCKISVSNEDSKIKDSELESIFDKFYRVHGIGDNINGSGLGLFICRKIIEAHGGNIAARNTDHGVCFEFIIPNGE